MITGVATKEAWEVKEGEYVKWDWTTWHKVLGIETLNGFTYLRLRGKETPVCSIWFNVELPWSRFPRS